MRCKLNLRLDHQTNLQPVLFASRRRRITADNTESPNIKTPPALKMCWKVGRNFVVVIDSTLVEKLGIDENTLLEEEITKEGILLRIVSVR